MASSEKAVATRPQSSVAVPDYGDEFGKGFEGQSGQDMVMPFISVLQSNSPQVEKGIGEGGIEGARAGMLFNTVTGEVFDGKKGLVLVPALTRHVVVEWRPRNQGGGYVGEHPTDHEPFLKAQEITRRRVGKFSTSYNDKGEPNGNDLIETFYVYGVVETESGEQSPAALAFTSTKVAVYKRWNTKINLFFVEGPNKQKRQPPLYAHRTRLTTIGQANSEGSFHNFVLAPDGKDEAGVPSIPHSLLPPDAPLFVAALGVYELAKSGGLNVAFDKQDAPSTEGATPAGGSSAPPKKAPF